MVLWSSHLQWKNYGTMEKNYSTMEKIEYYGNKPVILYGKLWNFDLHWKKTRALWKKLWYYSKLYLTMENYGLLLYFLLLGTYLFISI